MAQTVPEGYGVDIGTGKPHERVYESGSRLLFEDTEMHTCALYEIVDTVIHPKPELADKYMEAPYTFDALTGVMRLYRLVGVDESTEEGIERLLESATVV